MTKTIQIDDKLHANLKQEALIKQKTLQVLVEEKLKK